MAVENLFIKDIQFSEKHKQQVHDGFAWLKLVCISFLVLFVVFLILLLLYAVAYVKHFAFCLALDTEKARCARRLGLCVPRASTFQFCTKQLRAVQPAGPRPIRAQIKPYKTIYLIKMKVEAVLRILMSARVGRSDTGGDEKPT